MHPSALRHDIHLYTYLREKLLEAFPEADDETIRDTLEGLTTLNELIAEIIRSALIDEALQSGLRLRLQDMKERLSRLESRSLKKRDLAIEAMSEAGLRKIEQPDFTASARSGTPSLLVVAEDQIPESYWVPQPPKLDRQVLLGDLKQGDQVPGAQLSNPKPVLSVRTK
jgi:Siphovirus Gp157